MSKTIILVVVGLVIIILGGFTGYILFSSDKILTSPQRLKENKAEEIKNDRDSSVTPEQTKAKPSGSDQEEIIQEEEEIVE